MKIAHWQVMGHQHLFHIFQRRLGHFNGLIRVRLFLTLDSATKAQDLISQIIPTLLSAKVIDVESQIQTFCYYRADQQLGYEKDRIAIIIQEVE